MPKPFTVLMNAGHITAMQYKPSYTLEGQGGKLEVWYGATEQPITILDNDESFQYYFKHWENEKNKMLNEEPKEQEPVGPVEGGKK